MPTYEYLCGSCGHNFEQVQKISEDSLTDCPICKAPSLRRVMNATAFHLKGSGWYKTDYASSSSSSGGSSSSASSSKSEATETKTSSDTTSTTTSSTPVSSSTSKPPES